MQFVFPVLAWGFLLVLVPLFVHLINLMRHRRMQWAAMDFLLESYRKHRRWVWLKQAILLASRMLAMAVLVAMLAQWMSGGSWFNFFGETVTHHYVLLDDSYSMADTSQGRSAYQRGVSATAVLLRSAAAQGGSHQVTLMRISRAMQIADNADDAGKVDVAADIMARSLSSNPAALLERVSATSPSALEATFEPALRLIAPLIERASNQKAILYLVSDFRQKDWAKPEGTKALLEQLRQRDTRLELIDCVDAQHQNLTVDQVQPEEEILATGVPLMVRIQIRNQGSSVARNVQVRLQTMEFASQNGAPRPDQATSGSTVELPPIVIEKINPGEVVSRRVQAVFQQPGWHAVQVVLPEDSVQVDNQARCVVKIEDGQRVLLVDGDPSKRNSFFFEAMMNPGANARTGLVTRREGPEFLRDAVTRDLDAFSCIFLMDVPRLDRRAIANLESYVDRGGGLAIFLGDAVEGGSLGHMNDEWYRDGKGILPIRLTGAVDLPTATGEGQADLLPQSHPIFGPILGLRNSPFQFVRITRFVQSDEATRQGNENSPVRIFAKTRSGAPWGLDAPRGEGRVVVFMTGLSSQWTNWAQDPTIVVTSLKLVGYLSSFRRQDTSYRVGTDIAFEYSGRDMLPNMTAILPSSNVQSGRVAIDFNSDKNDDGNYRGSLRKALQGQSEDVLNAIQIPGIVELWGTRLQGERTVQTFAVNVSPSEGDLLKPTASELQQALSPVSYQYRLAENVQNSAALGALSTRNTFMMLILLAVLLFEQVMAWSASYHLPRVSQVGAS